MITKRENIACRPGTTDAMQRLADENEHLRSELTAAENLFIKQDKWLQSIVNITKGDPGELERHSTHDVVESVDALRVERDELASKQERMLKVMRQAEEALTRAMEEDIGCYHLVKRTSYLVDDTIDETPAQSLAQIKAHAVTDALEYATGQVGSDDSAESLVDAICEHLENLSDSKFPTVGSNGNTWRSIKAAGAREALERAMDTPGFSGTVVRVDLMREIIEQMEAGE